MSSLLVVSSTEATNTMLKKELATVKERNTILERQADARKIDIGLLQADNERLQCCLKAQEDTITGLSSEQCALLQLLESATKEKDQIYQKSERIEADMEELQTGNKRLASAIALNGQIIGRKNAEIEGRDTCISLLFRQMESAESSAGREAKDLRTHLKTAQLDVAAGRKRINDLNQQLRKSGQKVDTLQRQLVELEAAKKVLEHKLKMSCKAVADNVTKTRTVEKENAKLHDIEAELKNEASVLRGQIQNMEAMLQKRETAGKEHEEAHLQALLQNEDLQLRVKASESEHRQKTDSLTQIISTRDVRITELQSEIDVKKGVNSQLQEDIMENKAALEVLRDEHVRLQKHNLRYQQSIPRALGNDRARLYHYIVDEVSHLLADSNSSSAMHRAVNDVHSFFANVKDGLDSYVQRDDAKAVELHKMLRRLTSQIPEAITNANPTQAHNMLQNFKNFRNYVQRLRKDAEEQLTGKYECDELGFLSRGEVPSSVSPQEWSPLWQPEYTMSSVCQCLLLTVGLWIFDDLPIILKQFVCIFLVCYLQAWANNLMAALNNEADKHVQSL